MEETSKISIDFLIFQKFSIFPSPPRESLPHMMGSEYSWDDYPTTASWEMLSVVIINIKIKAKTHTHTYIYIYELIII